MTALCAVALFAVRDHSKDDTATIDEPFHIYAGADYVMRGVFVANPEHPPLAKDLAALSLLRARPNPPSDFGPSPMPSIAAQTEFLQANRVPFSKLLPLAREPFRWVLAALVVLVYLAARASFGPAAAVLASALIALDPNFIAHAGIVHTDVPVSLLMTATTVLTIAAVRGSKLLWLLAGVTLGLAIATKFTALLLIPLVVLAPLLVLLERAPRKHLLEQFAGAVTACIVAMVVVHAVYALNARNTPRENVPVAIEAFLRWRQAPPEMIDRYKRLARTSPEVALFGAGVQGVRLITRNGQTWSYLCGRVSRTGFPEYFPVAFLVKSTPAMLLVTAAALAGLWLLRTKWTVGLLVPVIALFLVSIPSALNFGIRHMLPVYPLLAIAGASVLAARLRPRAYALVAVLLIASAALSLRGSHPYELGYFNAIAGGTERGGEWLSDSNIDWGQDIGRLRVYIDNHATQRNTTAVVFGTAHAWRELEGLRPFDPTLPPGYYATSVNMERVGPYFTRDFEGAAAGDAVARLMAALKTRGRRVGRVGAAITVWELGPGR